MKILSEPISTMNEQGTILRYKTETELETVFPENQAKQNGNRYVNSRTTTHRQ